MIQIILEGNETLDNISPAFTAPVAPQVGDFIDYQVGSEFGASRSIHIRGKVYARTWHVLPEAGAALFLTLDPVSIDPNEALDDEFREHDAPPGASDST